MTKEYSLIKDGKVVNRIVADADFIEKIRGDCDLITDDPQAAKDAIVKAARDWGTVEKAKLIGTIK